MRTWAEIMHEIVSLLAAGSTLGDLAQKNTGRPAIIETGRPDDPEPGRLHIAVSAVPAAAGNSAARTSRRSWELEVVCCADLDGADTWSTDYAEVRESLAYTLALDMADAVYQTLRSGLGLVEIRECETDRWADTVAARVVFDVTVITRS